MPVHRWSYLGYRKVPDLHIGQATVGTQEHEQVVGLEAPVVHWGRQGVQVLQAPGRPREHVQPHIQGDALPLTGPLARAYPPLGTVVLQGAAGLVTCEGEGGGGETLALRTPWCAWVPIRKTQNHPSELLGVCTWYMTVRVPVRDWRVLLPGRVYVVHHWACVRGRLFARPACHLLHMPHPLSRHGLPRAQA